jgi:DivIVA domain-containing protein
MDERFESTHDDQADEDVPEEGAPDDRWADDGEEHDLPPDDAHEDAAAPDFAAPADTGGIADRLRAASFGVSRRGYDRRQVDEFLARIARRIEAETSSFDPDALKRQLQQVGESTTGILTAAEETARKLRSEAAREADELKRSATEMAERLRSEAKEFAETTRENASEEARRLRMEATQKAEQALAGAETRADELLEQSLQRRRMLEARIGRLLEERAGIVARLRDLSSQLANLASSDELGSTGEHDDDLPEEFEPDDVFEDDEPGTGEDAAYDEDEEGGRRGLRRNPFA